MPKEQKTNNMKTLLFYISNISKGGAQRVITTLSNHFSEQYQVILLTTTVGEGKYPLSPNITLLSLDLAAEDIQANKLTKNLKRNIRLKQIIQTYQPSVIITFLEREILRVLYLKPQISVPVIISFRNDPNVDYSSWLQRFAIMRLIKRADGIVFQTPDAKQFFTGHYASKDIIIPNPIHPTFLKERAIGSRDARIVTVGKLFPQKNHALLIRSFAQIASEFPEHTLEIYGEGELRNSLQQLIDSLGLQTRIYLKGVRNDIEKVLEQAALFVLSSDYEGVSNALMEAMALGLPVISTDCPCGGSAMLIRHGVNGLLVPVGDEGALVGSMRSMVKDPLYAEALGTEARKIRHEVDPQVVFASWEAFIHDVVSMGKEIDE
ncbi:MAG: glycosyltransferase family 4 protein [Clostridia bacterium]|nr:glycosyltransferase family 4 protein [Clostridia bacterium]